MNTDVLYCVMTRYTFDLNESVTYVTEARHLPVTQLKPRDSQSVGRDLEIWVEEIKSKFRKIRIDTPTDKEDTLFGGKDSAYLEKYLPEPDGILDEYQKLKKNLNAYFLPRRNKYLVRYLFLKMRARTGEWTVVYAIRFRERLMNASLVTLMKKDF